MITLEHNLIITSKPFSIRHMLQTDGAKQPKKMVQHHRHSTTAFNQVGGRQPTVKSLLLPLLASSEVHMHALPPNHHQLQHLISLDHSSMPFVHWVHPRGHHVTSLLCMHALAITHATHARSQTVGPLAAVCSLHCLSSQIPFTISANHAAQLSCPGGPCLTQTGVAPPALRPCTPLVRSAPPALLCPIPSSCLTTLQMLSTFPVHSLGHAA